MTTTNSFPTKPGAVRPLVGGDYVVASRSTPGAWWLVRDYTCSCPATTPTCFHLRQVAAFCRAIDANHVRPAMPPNISALVD